METKLSRDTSKHFARAIQNFLTSEVRGKAIFLCVALLVIFFAINGLNVVNSYVGRDFMTAIESKDQGGFVRYALLYLRCSGRRPSRRCWRATRRTCSGSCGATG